MRWTTRRGFMAAAAVSMVLAGSVLWAQVGPHGRGRMMSDPAHMEDMGVIHELLDNGDKITRTVTFRADGVETVTESDDPALVQSIRVHVAAMYARIKDGRPIHVRDPLFRAIFDHASQINLEHTFTAKGIKVTETSNDPYVVKLIQMHAEVLNAFIKNGRAEAMANHAVPVR